MTDGDSLLERVRAELAGRTTREVRMFGGVSVMVDERMLVAVRGSSDAGGEALLVRVDPTRSPELLARPGATQAEMGSGRSMGPSWISVASDAALTDTALREWLAIAADGALRAR